MTNYLPTAEEIADYILAVFNTSELRPGEVLRTGNFLVYFSKPGWRGSDFKPGMEFAVEHGWIEVLPNRDAFRLTNAGYGRMKEAGNMNLANRCNEKITLERKDETRFENVRALVTSKDVMIPDAKIPIEPDDIILRELPSGIVQRLVVTDPGFYAGGLAAAHYQVKYRHEGQKPSGSPGYVIHASNNSHVNINSNDSSVNQTDNSNQDLNTLAAELSNLRQMLSKQATLPEHYVSLGAISSAELAAQSGSPSGVKKALSVLGSSAKWVLEAAKDVSVPVAIAAIKSYAGLPPS